MASREIAKGFAYQLGAVFLRPAGALYLGKRNKEPYILRQQAYTHSAQGAVTIIENSHG